MPAGWVVRPVDRGDYGVDAEIEVFESGLSTGLTFKVQLKATDARRSPSVRVTAEHLRYWVSLDVPVLLVLYSSMTGTLHGKWANGDVPPGTTGPARVTVTFGPEHRLTSQTAEGLAGQVRLLRELARGQFPRPVPLDVRVPAPMPGGVTQDELRASVWALDPSRTLLRAARPGETAVTVEVTPRLVAAALPLGFGSGTYRLDGDYPANAVRVTLPGDIVVLVAVLMARLGRTADAADLAVLGGPTATLLRQPELAGEVAQALTDERRGHDAWILARSLLREGPRAEEAADLLLVPVTAGLEQLDAEDFASLRQLREAHADAKAAGPGAGTAWYNVAQLLGARGLHQDAGHALDRAAALDPAYRERWYFHRELGGTLFLSGQHAAAADAYELAFNTGAPEAEVLPLLADALFRSGQYARSLDVLARHQPAGVPVDRPAALAGVAVEFVTRITGLRRQQRRDLSDAEQEALENAKEGTQEGLGLTLLRDVDALAPLPWLAALGQRSPDDPDLFAMMLMFALLNETASWWLTTTMLAFASNQTEDIKNHVINSGLRFNRESYLGHLEAAVRESDLGFDPDDLLAAVYARAGAHAPARPPLVVTRLLGPRPTEYLEVCADGPINWRALLQTLHRDGGAAAESGRARPLPGSP